MSMTNRVFDTFVPTARQQPTSIAPGPVAAPPMFHEVLRDCGDIPLQSRARLSATSWPYRPEIMRKQKLPKPSTMTRALSWLKKQYPAMQEKRLRVAENIPLGEKRFVALVTVDGREFLIGGGASGVSLLSQWESGTHIQLEDEQTLPMRESFE
ncbi:MAG: flagellar biosynthetic protein FliO [Terracidiphilus sp.]|jgi:hypothetical protein